MQKKNAIVMMCLSFLGSASWALVAVSSEDRQLIVAASQGDFPSLSNACILGANINAQDRSDDTALHWAARNNHRYMVGELLRRGANPFVRNMHGEMPVDVAPPGSDAKRQLEQRAKPLF